MCDGGCRKIREYEMPTYIGLLNYTHHGMTEMSNAPDRIEASRQRIKDAGGELVGYYLTMGQYDAVVIVEMPDDEALAKLLLALGATGLYTTQTMRAFTLEEATGIFNSLS